jgi:quercetin dioxygenase-like cupin family protein
MKLERIAWDESAAPTEDILRGRLEADGFEVFTWEDAAGADYRPHAHDHDESLWVIEGEMTFGAEGKELRLGSGDRLMLPRGMVHTARAGREGARYLIGQRIARD